MLGNAAAAGAVALLRPPAVLATPQRQPVWRHWVGLLAGDSKPLSVPGGAQLMGVEWSDPAVARIELRSRLRGGPWGPWASASLLGHGPDRSPPPGAQRFGEPVWTGPADQVQLRSIAAVQGVRLHFVGSPHRSPARAAAAFALAQPVLPAGPGQPPIIARDAWAQGQAPPAFAPAYGTVKLAFVHHTENPNGYSAGQVPAMLLAIYGYHRYVRGWDDIGYNFVIDAFGRIWEARQGGIDEAVVGAQAGGYNQVSTGVAVLGSFVSVAPPASAIAALERLLAWKLSLHGVPSQGHVTVQVNPSDAFYAPFAPGAHVSLPRVAGHRDGDSTNCPGDAFYARLPAIRPRVTALAGRPAAATLSAARLPATAGAALELSGRLKLLGDDPLSGAPIELQQLTGPSAHTLWHLTTAADGYWRTALVLMYNTTLRALHRPAPAAVSDRVQVGVAPQITLHVDSLSPVRLSGQITPAKRTVTVELYGLANGHRRLVASKRVRVRGGQFSASLTVPRHGPHEARARSDADARNLAGASAVTVVNV